VGFAHDSRNPASRLSGAGSCLKRGEPTAVAPGFRLELTLSSPILGVALAPGSTGAWALVCSPLFLCEVAPAAPCALGKGGAVNFLRGFVGANCDGLVALYEVTGFESFREFGEHKEHLSPGGASVKQY
jgi:hypothetical protein